MVNLPVSTAYFHCLCFVVSYRQSIGVLSMTYKGHIANGTVVLDEPVPLDGTVVRVEVVAEAASTMPP